MRREHLDTQSTLLRLIERYPGQTRSWYERKSRSRPNSFEAALRNLARKRKIENAGHTGTRERVWYVMGTAPPHKKPRNGKRPDDNVVQWSADAILQAWHDPVITMHSGV